MLLDLVLYGEMLHLVLHLLSDHLVGWCYFVAYNKMKNGSIFAFCPFGCELFFVVVVGFFNYYLCVKILISSVFSLDTRCSLPMVIFVTFLRR